MIGDRRRVLLQRVENSLSGLLIVIAVVMAWRFLLPNEISPVRPPPTIVDEWRSFAVNGHRLGPPDSPLTIVVFSDYECPYCWQLWEALDSVRLDPTSGISVVYRHYFNTDNHPNAMKAAVAVECAAKAGRFLEYHRLLFANQGSLNSAPWMRLATQAGVGDLAGFDRCVSAETVATRIAEDRQAAERLGVRGTPTFLVNDERWIGGMRASELRLLLRRKLTESVVRD